MLRLEWIEGFSDDAQRRDVPTVEELDRALDQLTERARQIGTPRKVSLAHTDATVMWIVVGADVAYVEWIRFEPWSCLAGVRAGPTLAYEDDELVLFAGNGQRSELPRRMWIDVGSTREVMRRYFTTRELVSSACWATV